MSDTCRSCKAPIIWGATEKGRRIPLDPAPVAGGNLELERLVTPLGSVLRVRYVGKDDIHAHIARHITHFATCKFAKRHRSKAR